MSKDKPTNLKRAPRQYESSEKGRQDAQKQAVFQELRRIRAAVESVGNKLDLIIGLLSDKGSEA